MLCVNLKYKQKLSLHWWVLCWGYDLTMSITHTGEGQSTNKVFDGG